MSDKPYASRRHSADGGAKATLEALAARPAPSAVTAEQVVLGSILRDPLAAERVLDLITTADFFAENHRILYAEILEIGASSLVPELELLIERLVGKDLLQKAGGIDYLASLSDAAPEPANVGQYARLVAQRSAQRQIIGVATQALQAAHQPGNRVPAELIAETTQQLFDVADRSRAKGEGPRSIVEIMKDAVGQIETAYGREDKDAPLGLTFGFTDLDRKTLGMQRGDLIILAARPSMGKTALALNIAEKAAGTSAGPLAVFSMEMGATQLAMRLIAAGARVDATALRTGRIENQDWDGISSTIGRFASGGVGGAALPIFIDDTPGLSPMEMRARCLRLQREARQPLGLIVIDYLQLMAGTRSSYGNDDVQRVSDISGALKLMARELDVPVLALAQLNRGLEGRDNKRPRMSDLRGSGSIEQDGDQILFIYRDEIYNPDSADKGIAEILIGKNRNGPIGEVKLTWLAEQMRFENNAFTGRGDYVY